MNSVVPGENATGDRVFRNSLWNILGALAPIPVALICIPVLVHALGLERFGVLGVAWMVMGYFGMFDFGLGQSTTRFVAQRLAHGEKHTLRALTYGSLLLHTLLGLTGAAIFALLAPWLAQGVFAVPPELVVETRSALYWLAASVPAIVMTAALRGALEGMQRFDVVNLIRVPASIVNYAGPVIALYFGTTLPLVVAVIVIARFAVLLVYAAACMSLLPPGPGGFRAESAALARLATYGGWLTVSNLVNPLIVSADRFVIAAGISAGAVAFYVAPYEIITKAWILSASMMGAMFPVFAALSAREPHAVRAACRTAEAQLLFLAAPGIALLLGCADWLLEGWLGADFRNNSTVVAHLLAAGILVNIAAQVPLTALNAAGRGDITAKIALIELPLYGAAVWYCAARYGIAGVAAVWTARAAVDALALFIAANAVFPHDAHATRPGRITRVNVAVICVLLAACWLAGTVLKDDAVLRSAALLVLIGLLLAWEWRQLLGWDEREHLRAWLTGLFVSKV